MQNSAAKGSKPRAPRGKNSVSGSPPHQVRIIGGQWKRTPLKVPDIEGLRPTPDRVRETVFNWLNHLLDGQWQNLRCLDLFAGSGALGYEAASRGAASVMLVEANRTAAAQLEMTQQKLGAQQVRVVCGDAFAVARELAARQLPEQRFQLIFLDPPFHQGWLPKILPICEQLLAEDGLLYVEAEHSLADAAQADWLENWQVIRSDKAGMVFYQVLKSNKSR